MFRWTVYTTFMALMLFMAVCISVGILANISERYPELEVPDARPESLGDISALQLENCREALLRMRQEDLHQTRAALTGELGRDAFLRQYRTWSRDWRKQFEKLGVSCRLTENRYDGHTTLGSLAQIYRRLDAIHKNHERLVKRYVTENASPLREVKELFERTGQRIDLSGDQAGSAEH